MVTPIFAGILIFIIVITWIGDILDPNGKSFQTPKLEDEGDADDFLPSYWKNRNY